jgi:uncharacterized protein
MPVQPTYPGVYIEEIPSGVRTITGVSTSVAAFIGAARRGPINKAVHILSYADYERRFGGLDAGSEMSYSVRQFFANGGTDSWVVRLALDVSAASLRLKHGATDVLDITALEEGSGGNAIEVRVDYNTVNPASTFNLTFIFESPDDPNDIRTETFTNLSMNSKDARYVEDIVNGSSQLVEVERPAAATAALTGEAGALRSGELTNVTSLVDPTHNQLRVSVNGAEPVNVTLTPLTASETLADLCTQIQAQVTEKVADFTCEPATTGSRIVMTSGTTGEASSVRVLPGQANDVSSRLELGELSGGEATDAAAKIRPDVIPVSSGGPVTLAGGSESPLTPDRLSEAYLGSRAQRKGLFALEAVDLFNLLCLPGITAPGILQDSEAYCRERRAFLIIDAHRTSALPEDMVTTITGTSLPKSDYAAVYYPWIKIADPLKGGKLRTTAPCGTIAGLYARTDATRGVWKAPAGTDATLTGVQAVEYVLTDRENGTLNPLGVNCIRVLPVYGAVSWGARTLRGADAMASEWKYIPVRRLALYIEESLYRGTQWVVFEPNDEPLWSQIRLNLGAFMNTLFRQGAFQGKTPREAYLVKCDRETTTQDDINRGVVNILVGFAPLKPAEFVILKIQQLAGQIQT